MKKKLWEKCESLEPKYVNYKNRNGIGFWLELLESGVLGITRVFPIRVQPGFNPYAGLKKNFVVRCYVIDTESVIMHIL